MQTSFDNPLNFDVPGPHTYCLITFDSAEERRTFEGRIVSLKWIHEGDIMDTKNTCCYRSVNGEWYKRFIQ